MAVYFAERGGLIKIGCSANVTKRIDSLGARPLATLPDGTFATEAELHRVFEADRVVGEWFRPSLSLMTYIRIQARPYDGGDDELTLHQASVLLGLARPVVQQLASEHRIPSWRTDHVGPKNRGFRLRFRRADVEAFRDSIQKASA